MVRDRKKDNETTGARVVLGVYGCSCVVYCLQYMLIELLRAKS